MQKQTSISYGKFPDTIVTKSTILSADSEYQTVTVKREEKPQITNTYIEELIKTLVPAQSFLYRNHKTKTGDASNAPYVSMSASDSKKHNKLFRLSSNEYPFWKFRLRSSKVPSDSYHDRGYYTVENNQKSKATSRAKYKSLCNETDLYNDMTDDHLYEDLCYDTVSHENSNTSKTKPRMTKFQELIKALKSPFAKRKEESKVDETINSNAPSKEETSNFYENTVEVGNIYDTVKTPKPIASSSRLPKDTMVEDYLEPIPLNREYCDVDDVNKEDSLLTYIMSLIETKLGIRKEINEPTEIEDSAKCETEVSKSEVEAKFQIKSNMASRPLPVPVENESYYMKVDRSEAENLLKGLPDGAFILRPSSQPNHAYTLSVACSGAVHNIGVRKRPDGRLSLGYARRNERNFSTVTSLVRHHQRRRLLLITGGNVLGATTLNESPSYYQTPINVPIRRSNDHNSDSQPTT